MFDLLNSDWLIKMLEKSSSTPQGRILALFDIVNDWLDAPHTQASPLNLRAAPPPQLLIYLSQQAQLAHIDQPELFANQVYFMLLTAVQSTHTASRAQHFNHAKTALDALLSAQRKPKRWKRYGSVAGIAAALLVGFTLGLYALHSEGPSKHLPSFTSAVAMTTPPSETQLSPLDTSEFLAKIEQMRRGNCRFVEALQIPDKDKAVYINVVVNGQAPRTRQEMDVAEHYLEQVQCNYTPMLMSNSRN